MGSLVDNINLGLGDILTLYLNPPNYVPIKEDKYHVFAPNLNKE